MSELLDSANDGRLVVKQTAKDLFRIKVLKCSMEALELMFMFHDDFSFLFHSESNIDRLILVYFAVHLCIDDTGCTRHALNLKRNLILERVAHKAKCIR